MKRGMLDSHTNLISDCFIPWRFFEFYLIGLASLMVTRKRVARIDSLQYSSYRKNNDFDYNENNTLTSIINGNILKLFERPSVC